VQSTACVLRTNPTLLSLKYVEIMNPSVPNSVESQKLMKDFCEAVACVMCGVIPMPPTFVCSKPSGHPYCFRCTQNCQGICKYPVRNSTDEDRVEENADDTNSAICGESITPQRSKLVETIYLLSSFRCNFRDNGCTEIITGQMFMEHQEKCPHR
jgi:hypothetical protein